MRVVIDTNVAIAANGRNTHACLRCQLACVEFLEELTAPKSKKVIFLDESDLLLTEYKPHLNFNGQPGVGDAFYKFLHDNKYHGKRLQLVSITKNDDADLGFDELPINQVDPSDRKILAIALVGRARIVNALDTDWDEQSEFVAELGLNIQQLCPEHGLVKS